MSTLVSTTTGKSRDGQNGCRNVRPWRCKYLRSWGCTATATSPSIVSRRVVATTTSSSNTHHHYCNTRVQQSWNYTSHTTLAWLWLVRSHSSGIVAMAGLVWSAANTGLAEQTTIQGSITQQCTLSTDRFIRISIRLYYVLQSVTSKCNNHVVHSYNRYTLTSLSSDHATCSW